MTRPRATFHALVHTPAWLTTWILILILWGACAAWFLSTGVGQQALVDERVRVVETFGGRVTDAEYEAWVKAPPWWIYFSSGGRALLLPTTTLAVAAIVFVVARGGGSKATMHQALALTVHASVVLLLGQILATPLHYVRESLTTPFNLAALLPLIEDGSMAARFFGAIDLFALWWAGLLALGLATLTGRSVRQYAWRIAALFLVFAAVTAAVIAAMGGA